jgi:hypothetical protein
LREEERETREKERRETERGYDLPRLPYVAVNGLVVAANAFAARFYAVNTFRRRAMSSGRGCDVQATTASAWCEGDRGIARATHCCIHGLVCVVGGVLRWGKGMVGRVRGRRGG